jgi:hypothetical protein
MGGSDAASMGEVRQIEGYSADWLRWDNLSQQLGLQELPQPERLSQILAWAEAQMVYGTIAAGQNLPQNLSQDLSQELDSKQTVGLASQLLTTMNRLSVQFQQQQQQQQQFNNALVQVLQMIASGLAAPRGAAASAAKRRAAIAKGSFSEFESKDLRRSHAKGSAEEKLRRAFGAIVSHNEAAGGSPSEKWAINQNALAELTGCNRPAIKEFLKQYGPEIEAHHQLHQLHPRHNYSHGKNGVKITDVIRW